MPERPGNITIHPAGVNAPLSIPLSQVLLKAGFPSPAQDYMEGDIDINNVLVRHKEATFYVRISGDSMAGASILDGDLAVVDRSLEPKDGDFVVAFVDGEPTIKQFRVEQHPGQSGTRAWLVPWNEHFPRIPINGGDVVLWGVVTFVIHEVKGTSHAPMPPSSRR